MWVMRRHFCAASAQLLTSDGTPSAWHWPSWPQPSLRRLPASSTGSSCTGPFAGAGTNIVVLHGLCDSERSWWPVMAELGRQHRVFGLDLPGCGLSGRPDASYTIDWQARLIAAWLDELGINECDVIGHSYGGGLAMWLLLYRAHKIRRLALVAFGRLGPRGRTRAAPGGATIRRRAVRSSMHGQGYRALAGAQRACPDDRGSRAATQLQYVARHCSRLRTHRQGRHQLAWSKTTFHGSST